MTDCYNPYWVYNIMHMQGTNYTAAAVCINFNESVELSKVIDFCIKFWDVWCIIILSFATLG